MPDGTHEMSSIFFFKKKLSCPNYTLNSTVNIKIPNNYSVLPLLKFVFDVSCSVEVDGEEEVLP